MKTFRCSDVFAICLLSFSVVVLSMMSRNLSLTMLCIVNPPNPEYANANLSRTAENLDVSNGQTHEQHKNVSKPAAEKYDMSSKISNFSARIIDIFAAHQWSVLEQSHVISVFSWGKLAMLPISAFVIRRADLKLMLLFGAIASGTATVAFPTAVDKGGWIGALLVRLILGALAAFASPSVDALCSQLIPKSIKSTAYAVVTSGAQVAVMICAPMGAYFCTHPVIGGWSSVFYVTAVLTAVWSALWLCFIRLLRQPEKTSVPAEIRKGPLTEEHKSLLIESKDPQRCPFEVKKEVKGRVSDIKLFYQNILADRACWALYPCELAANFTIYLYVFYIPRYYQDVLHISLTANGYFTALPFLVQLLSKVFVSALVDVLRRISSLPPTVISKIFNSIGFAGSGICLLLTVTIDNLSPENAVQLICLGFGFYSCTTPGFRTSYISINPEWSGVISVVCAVFAVVGGMLFPYLVGVLVPQGTKPEWRLLFGIIFTLDMVAVFVYNVLGTVQSRTERVRVRSLNRVVSRVSRNRYRMTAALT